MDTESPLKQLLDTYSEIKKQFDLTAEKHPATRAWLGKLLNIISKHKPQGPDPITIKAIIWTLIKLRKRSFKLSKTELEKFTPGQQKTRREQYLFAHGNAIYVEEYRKYFLLEVKREKERRRSMSHIRELIERREE